MTLSTLSKKALRIRTQLAKLYPPPLRPPLNSASDFQHLCAVLLSAQTTDKKVNEASPALFELAPDAAAMASAKVDEIKDCIRTLGLAPTKARRLNELSSIILEKHNGEVPADMKALEALPGVGHKTAWGLSDGSSVEKTEKDLKLLYPEESWADLHLQIIFYGREHGQANQTYPFKGPICEWAALENPPPTTPAKKRKAALTPTKKKDEPSRRTKRKL